MTSKNIITTSLRFIPWSIRRNIKNIPWISHFQRYLFSKFLDGKNFIHLVDAGPAKGVNFRVFLPEDKGIWTGTYEDKFAEHLAKAVGPETIAYDIGGWHGFFAGVLSSRGAECVHIFEPLPSNIKRISEMISLNLDKKIILHKCAVGNEDTKMDLVVMSETSMAKLEASEFQSDNRPDSRIQVSVRSLDAMVKLGEIAPPDLMKVDVEGAEMLVLQGAKQILSKHHPLLFIEVHSSSLLTECTDFLTNIGYTIKSLDDDQAYANERDVFQIRASF